MSYVGINIGALTVKVAAVRGDASSATGRGPSRQTAGEFSMRYWLARSLPTPSTSGCPVNSEMCRRWRRSSVRFAK
jgi:hypothetical protein